MSNPSPFTPSIGFIKYRRAIPIITLIQVDSTAVEYLAEEIKLLLDPDNSNPNLDTVAYYTSSHPKTPPQSTMSKSNEDNAKYVIFQIKERFVSLDKHFDRISIQVSKNTDDVLHKFGGIDRDGKPKLIKESKGNMAVNELSNFIADSGFRSDDLMKDLFEKATAVPTEHWVVDEEKVIKVGAIAFVIAFALGTAPVFSAASGAVAVSAVGTAALNAVGPAVASGAVTAFATLKKVFRW